MALLDRILEPPSYGFEKDGNLVVPTHRELFREFFSRLNIFRDKKNWVAAICWAATVLLAVPFFFFVIYHFSWGLLLLGFWYSMFFLGTHGTIWFHRYATHRAYTFSGPIPRFIVRNLAIKIIPEELYVVSHYVHHRSSEKPGDPYNVNGGWLYCFLADAIHQPIHRNLSREDYTKLTLLMNHTGVRLNSYEQYQKWGSLCHPARTVAHFILNWCFWYGAFYLMGGHALATCLFGASCFWAFGVRTFNFDGHGGGKDKRRPGWDFDDRNLSINQVWPGAVTGEWHSNHHLYPNGVRAGFLPGQFDPAWQFIRLLIWMGCVTSFKDYQQDFLEKHYYPYLAKKNLQIEPTFQV